MVICTYCNTVLGSAKSLYNHQRRAKYCLKIQQKQGVIKQINYLSCQDCKKQFTIKQEYMSHTYICIERYRRELGELKEENKELKEEVVSLKEVIIRLQAVKEQIEIHDQKTTECLHEIAKQPRTIQNTQNNQNNLLLLTPFDLGNADIQQMIQNTVDEHFGKDYFLEGPKGVAQFAVDKLLKDTDGKLKYICTDPSRHIFKFRGDDGDIRRDVKAQRLTSLLTPSVKSKSAILVQENGDFTNIHEDPYVKKCKEVGEIENDNSTFRSELSALTVNV